MHGMSPLRHLHVSTFGFLLSIQLVSFANPYLLRDHEEYKDWVHAGLINGLIKIPADQKTRLVITFIELAEERKAGRQYPLPMGMNREIGGRGPCVQVEWIRCVNSGVVLSVKGK